MPVCAHAAKRFYIAGYMGLNIFPDQDFSEESTGYSGQFGLEEGQSFAGAIGFKLTPQLRLEGEFSHLTAGFNGVDITNIGAATLGGDVTSQMAMLSIYYDLDFNWKKMRPFIGAGVGYGWHEGSVHDYSGYGLSASGDSAGILWQVGGGVRYPLAKTLALIGAYRYLDGQDLEFSGYDINYGTHEFRMGLSWDLPID